MRPIADYLKANPQALVLLAICVVLGLGTFLAVVFGLVSSGSTTTSGYSSGAILGLPFALGRQQAAGRTPGRAPCRR